MSGGGLGVLPPGVSVERRYVRADDCGRPVCGPCTTTVTTTESQDGDHGSIMVGRYTKTIAMTHIANSSRSNQETQEAYSAGGLAL